MKDYYETLGVPKSAGKEEIKQAYRKLAHQFHPDKGGDEKKFKEINEAYQILGDERKREHYDQFGSAFNAQSGKGSSGFEGFDFGNFDFSDAFSEFFGGGARSTARTKTRGSDIRVDFLISLEEAFTGLEKSVSLKKYTLCDKCGGKKNEPGTSLRSCASCGGSGEVRKQQRVVFGIFTQVTICNTCNGEGQIPEKKCNKCRGAGRVQAIENIAIKIPAGINSGEALRIAGKGEAGEGGYGDLYAYIRVKDHAAFERDGDDVFSTAEISFSQAALGDTVFVKTLGRDEALKIPTGVESGEMIKLNAKGMPSVHGSGRGDHYVKIVVKMPKHLSKRAKELIEELRKEGV